MKTRRRLSRWSHVCKWLGVILFLTITMGWCASFRGSPHLVYRGRHVTIGVWSGCLSFGSSTLRRDDTGWWAGLSQSIPDSIRWWPALFRKQRPADGYYYWRVALPLWLLALVIAVPTLFLWWCGRRFPAGHCRSCGYDLTGNTSGKCPECGCPFVGEDATGS